MSEALPSTHRGAIRLNLVLPVCRFGFGPFSIDPVEQLIGAPVADILEPLMIGPVQRRPSASGTAVEVYPLALPDGEGAAIPLGQFGELGFQAKGGLLLLTAPWTAAPWLQDRFGTALVAGPHQRIADDGAALLAECWVRLKTGMRAAFPLGALGEMAIEAA